MPKRNLHIYVLSLQMERGQQSEGNGNPRCQHKSE